MRQPFFVYKQFISSFFPLARKKGTFLCVLSINLRVFEKARPKHFNLIVDYEEALAFIMNYIEANDYIINCAYDSIGREEMKRFFYVDFIELITSIIDSAEKETGHFLSEDYKKFICSFYTEALAGMLIDWVKNYKTKNREQVIEYLVKTMKTSLMGILEFPPATEQPDFTSR